MSDKQFTKAGTSEWRDKVDCPDAETLYGDRPSVQYPVPKPKPVVTEVIEVLEQVHGLAESESPLSTVRRVFPSTAGRLACQAGPKPSFSRAHYRPVE